MSNRWRWVVPMAHAILSAVPANADVPPWLEGHWAMAGKACVSDNGRRLQASGMTFLEQSVQLHPPVGFESLDLTTREVGATYEPTPEGVAVDLALGNDEVRRMTLVRLAGDRIRDVAGYVYRRCVDVVS